MKSFLSAILVALAIPSPITYAKKENIDKQEQRTKKRKQAEDIVEKIKSGVVKAKDTDLSYYNFSHMNLDNINFNDAILESTSFYGASLRGAHLENARLRRANFEDATLVDADLTGAFLHEANFSHADLTNAKLDNVSVRRTNFNCAKGANRFKRWYNYITEWFDC